MFYVSVFVFFFMQKTAYELRISAWSSDVCSSDLFVAYALGNTVGLGVLTGGAVRMRMYHAAGVETPQVGRAITFNALAFGIGISTLGALGLLWGGKQVATIVGVSPNLLRSEEHTSELQSLMRISYAVFCLKKKNHTTHNTHLQNT